jgi:hypothetical protein
VGLAAELIAAILLPTALGFGTLGTIRVLRWAAQRRSRPPAVEPVDRLADRLRRLRAELEALETRPDVPHKGARLRALRAAYIDVLATACARLEISPPGGVRATASAPAPSGPRAQVPQAEIYRVEAALRQHGLDVREPASR